MANGKWLMANGQFKKASELLDKLLQQGKYDAPELGGSKFLSKKKKVFNTHRNVRVTVRVNVYIICARKMKSQPIFKKCSSRILGKNTAIHPLHFYQYTQLLRANPVIFKNTNEKLTILCFLELKLKKLRVSKTFFFLTQNLHFFDSPNSGASYLL